MYTEFKKTMLVNFKLTKSIANVFQRNRGNKKLPPFPLFPTLVHKIINFNQSLIIEDIFSLFFQVLH